MYCIGAKTNLRKGAMLFSGVGLRVIRVAVSGPRRMAGSSRSRSASHSSTLSVNGTPTQ